MFESEILIVENGSESGVVAGMPANKYNKQKVYVLNVSFMQI